MKSIKFLYVFTFLIIVACNDNRKNGVVRKLAENPVKQEERSSPTDRINVEAAVKRVNNAIINPTQDSLDAVAADELTYGHSSGKVQDKDEFIDDLIKGDYDFESINISDQTIQLAGDVAVVRQIFDSEAKNVDEPVHIHIGNVLVFQKQEGEWKLLARQAFRL